MITKNNVREKLSFIKGQEELNDNELFAIYQNITPIFGSDLKYINSNTTLIVSKDIKKFEISKSLYFCCGCSEFIIHYNKIKIYLAFDF